MLFLLLGLNAKASATDDYKLFHPKQYNAFKCVFYKAAYGDWKKNGIEIDTKDENMSIAFSKFDYGNNTGIIEGNQSAEPVIVHLMPLNLTIMEITGNGSVNIVTIVVSDKGNKEFKAVYSRHIYGLGQFIPSQRYGFCAPR